MVGLLKVLGGVAIAGGAIMLMVAFGSTPRYPADPWSSFPSLFGLALGMAGGGVTMLWMAAVLDELRRIGGANGRSGQGYGFEPLDNHPMASRVSKG